MMSDFQVMIEETANEVCDKLCRYSDTVTEEGCEWCREHEGECPLDKLLDFAGLK